MSREQRQLDRQTDAHIIGASSSIGYIRAHNSPDVESFLNVVGFLVFIYCLFSFALFSFSLFLWLGEKRLSISLHIAGRGEGGYGCWEHMFHVPRVRVVASLVGNMEHSSSSSYCGSRHILYA